MKEQDELGLISFLIEWYQGYYRPSDLKPSVWPNMYAHGTLEIVIEKRNRALEVTVRLVP